MNEQSMEGFLNSLGNVMSVRMNLSLYEGEFDCACGKKHEFGNHIRLLCQGSWSVVMECPDDADYLTYVKIKMFLMVKFKGFKKLSGYHVKNERENSILRSTFNSLP
jgi:hypothetical protein